MGIHASIQHLAHPIAALKPYPRNPRRGNIKAIAESLKASGQYRAVVANKSTGEILAGNHTCAAARSLGWTELAVQWVDVDDETAARIVIADNRTSDLAENDDTTLTELLDSLPTLEGTGYSAKELDDLLARMTQDPPLDFDDEPETPTKPDTTTYSITVVCDHEQDQTNLIMELKERGYTVRPT